jgi:hypothetical protein
VTISVYLVNPCVGSLQRRIQVECTDTGVSHQWRYLSSTCMFCCNVATKKREAYYKDDILSINNMFSLAIFKVIFFLILLVFQNTTGIRKSASKLDLYTEIYDETRLICNLYDKWDDFKSQIVSFPFLCSNITAEHARGA